MKLGEKLEKSQIVRILILISIVVTLIFTITAMVGNRTRFDNNKVYGEFTGEFQFINEQRSVFKLNLTFDGKKEYSGYIVIDDVQYDVSSSFTCIDSTVEFSLFITEIDVYFSCNGIITDSGTFIEGDVRYYLTAEDIWEGTFLISKYS